MSAEVNAAVSAEQRFFATVAGLEGSASPSDPVAQGDLAALDRWLDDLGQALRPALPQPTGLIRIGAEGSLAGLVDALDEALSRCEQRWTAQWLALQPARQVAERFDGQAMLLVFGKFNAGKSSLCNFLAERCAAHGGSVRGFEWTAGGSRAAAASLAVGATETTGSLQGLVLAERLVLLDTPGLHSLTADNAELTRRFTDSADGLLWLTSSASPGQVQELDELSRELQRDKPLLPVLTRSDFIEEDEIDGELRRQLRNKSGSNRQLQEDDVAVRARARLIQLDADPQLLRPPVSISVSAARAEGFGAEGPGAERPGAEGLAGAGFDRLYASLQAMIEPALAYKAGKSAAMRRHHLREQVLGELTGRLLPLVATLEARLRQEALRLAGLADAMAESVWRQLVPRLPGLLDQAAGGLTMADAGRQLAQWGDEAVAAAAAEQLAEFRRDPLAAMVIALPALPVAAAATATPTAFDLEQTYLALQDGVRQAAGHCAVLVGQAQGAVTRLQDELAALRQLIDRFDQRLLALGPSSRNEQ